MTPLTISLLALCLTAVNAAVGICNFVLSRCRLIKVREIAAFYERNAAGADMHFTVDVLSYGASVWDVEVWIEMQFPLTPENVQAEALGRYSMQLVPISEYLNPLQAGQGILFEIRQSKLRGNGSETSPIDRRYMEALRTLPHRNVSLCIYSSGKRKQLRRIRSTRFHWKLDQFLNGVMGAKPSIVDRVHAWFEIRRIRREDSRVRTLRLKNKPKTGTNSAAKTETPNRH
jgi:hypothetical protein